MPISLKTLAAKSSSQQKIVASELRKQRINAELSQDELAQRAGIDRKTINRIENGHFSPTLDTITRLCVVLKITPGTLLGSGRSTKK
ncbi:MAG: helix-turn-helix transcriptional regulator [Ilumatobacteraceae bacterium]|jgi:DNA-binding XRE family transcriptional regulator|nr:helix-turn-helix transcriptional regulator [Ilumatobacteraceae bacterium]MBJ7421649.1 helix-turn-helix transcriptional regulator [Ilumatobacteraceae bacterium]